MKMNDRVENAANAYWKAMTKEDSIPKDGIGPNQFRLAAKIMLEADDELQKFGCFDVGYCPADETNK